MKKQASCRLRTGIDAQATVLLPVFLEQSLLSGLLDLFVAGYLDGGAGYEELHGRFGLFGDGLQLTGERPFDEPAEPTFSNSDTLPSASQSAALTTEAVPETAIGFSAVLSSRLPL